MPGYSFLRETDGRLRSETSSLAPGFPWAGAGGGTATTSYAYDAQDHLSQVTDAEGNVTSYVYSDRDLLTSQNSVASGATTFGNNEHGELTSEFNAVGVTMSRTVDGADRVIFVDYPTNSLDVTNAYGTDPAAFNNGRLLSITRDGNSIDYAYDSFGRQAMDGALVFDYDKNGNRDTVEYLGGSGGGGITAAYTFDYADRHESLSVDAGTGPQTFASNATYLPSGPLATVDLGNGFTEARAFDDRYFPSSIAVAPTGGGTAIFSWSYDDVDGVGNIRSIADTLDRANDKTYAYQDHHYFLACASGPWETGAAGDCLLAPPTGQPIQWTYNKIGNRLDEIRDGNPVDTYVYQSSGASPVLDRIDLGSGNTKTYSYDAAGSLTSIADLQRPQDSRTYAVDDANRMATIESAPDVLGTMTYDGRGFLNAAEFPNLSVPGQGDFTYPTYGSDGRLYHQQDNEIAFNQVVKDNYVVYFAGRPIATLEDRFGFSTPRVRYLTTDHLGTPVLAVNAAGTITFWEGGFEPFGDDYNGASAGGVFLRFPGQWTDRDWDGGQSGAGLDFTYNVHRWYESGTGRYGRVDPMGMKEGPDVYAYADSRPAFFTDPLGLELFTPILVPPRDCFCAAEALRRNYRDLRQANWKNSDQYFHCKGNCEATRCGPNGRSCACFISNAREILDQLLGDQPFESFADQIANLTGRSSATTSPNTACSVNCQAFRPRNLPPQY